MSINDIFVGQQVCKQAHTHAKLYRTHATVLHLFRQIFWYIANDKVSPIPTAYSQNKGS